MLHSDLLKGIKEFSKEIKASKKVDWEYLNKNPAAIHLHKKNKFDDYENRIYYYMFWSYLVPGSLFISSLENNLNSIDWRILSENPVALTLIEKHLDKVNWKGLSYNPAAVDLLEKNLNEVNWNYLSGNPAVIHLLEEKY